MQNITLQEVIQAQSLQKNSAAPCMLKTQHWN